MEMSPLRRLTSAWMRHGITGFPKLIAKNVAYYATRLVSGRLFEKDQQATSECDEAYGIETEKIHEVGALDIATAKNARHAVRYQPSPLRVATETISALDIDHKRFSFLDFGAGKGRVLVIAGQFPFKSVIGIEFSRELCEIATRNIARIAPAQRAAAAIECINEDVTACLLPDTPLVCYFYNPFDRVIMSTVVEKLVASLLKAPREIFIIYLQPKHRELFEDSGYWRVVREEGVMLVLRAHFPGSSQCA